MPILIVIIVLLVAVIVAYYVFRNTAVGKVAGAVGNTAGTVANTGDKIADELGKLASPLTLAGAIQKRVGGGTKAEAASWRVLVTYLFNYSKRCKVSRPKTAYRYTPTLYAEKGTLLYARLPMMGLRPWCEHPDTKTLHNYLVLTPNAIMLLSQAYMVLLPEELNTLANLIGSLRPNVDMNGNTDDPWVFDRDYCPQRIAHAVRAITAAVPEFSGAVGHVCALAEDPTRQEIMKMIGITGACVIFITVAPGVEPKSGEPYTAAIGVLEQLWAGAVPRTNFWCARFADAPNDLNHGQFADTASPGLIDPVALQAEVDKYASQTF